MLKLNMSCAGADAEATSARLALGYADANHRIANSLQFLAATMSKHARETHDAVARSVLIEAQQRLAAIGALHRLLQDTGSSELVMVDELLEGLVEALGQAWVDPAFCSNIKLTCLPIVLPKGEAVSLAMITSELVCNALKYAYPVGVSGEIRVRVVLDRPGSLVLTVEDDGCGMSTASSSGTGGRIVRSIAARIAATIEQGATHRGTRIIVRAEIGRPL